MGRKDAGRSQLSLRIGPKAIVFFHEMSASRAGRTFTKDALAGGLFAAKRALHER